MISESQIANRVPYLWKFKFGVELSIECGGARYIFAPRVRLTKCVVRCTPIVVRGGGEGRGDDLIYCLFGKGRGGYIWPPR